MITYATATLPSSVVFSHCVQRQEHCCSGPSLVPPGSVYMLENLFFRICFTPDGDDSSVPSPVLTPVEICGLPVGGAAYSFGQFRANGRRSAVPTFLATTCIPEKNIDGVVGHTKQHGPVGNGVVGCRKSSTSMYSNFKREE